MKVQLSLLLFTIVAVNHEICLQAMHVELCVLCQHHMTCHSFLASDVMLSLGLIPWPFIGETMSASSNCIWIRRRPKLRWL